VDHVAGRPGDRGRSARWRMTTALIRPTGPSPGA
jgi:hypothetical protein